jgi:hypothetical protein
MASWLDTVFGGGAEKEAATKDIAAANQYGQTANTALQQGYQTGTGAIGSAIGAYQPLVGLGQYYNQGGQLLGGALGFGGPQGTAAAQAAFQNAPGYQGAITAGLDAINRRRGVGSMSNSGNADEDALTFAQNLQNQQYNTWLQNLQSTAGMGLQATGQGAAGTAAGYGSLADLAQNYATNQAGVAGNIENTTVGANNLQAAGQAAGAKNLLGAGMSLASLAMGGGGGFGSLLGGGGASAVPGAVGPTSVGGQPLGKSPTWWGGMIG